MEFVHLVFTRKSGESYRSRLGDKIRENQFLFKAGHSHLRSQLVQHINTHIHTVTC